jgi:Ser/Thr protein kinase RdoA (MazF antagonist)
MRDLFPTAHSVPDAAVLARLLAETYTLPAPVECRLLRFGWNDTFAVRAAGERFVLRVYGAEWRTPEEIRFELALLAHLKREGAGVAAPLSTTDGAPTVTLRMAEGERPAALFEFAPGEVPGPLPLGTPSQSRAVGEAMARLHAASDGFTCPPVRPAADHETAVRKPLEVIRVHLAHRTGDLALVETMAARLEERFAGLERDPLDRGPIHGDPMGGNAALTEDLRVTWFDFDFCGVGPRAWDVACAFGTAMGLPNLAERGAAWEAFLGGYQGVRPLRPAALMAIPVLLAASDFFFTAVNLRKAAIRGGEFWGSDRHLDQCMEKFREHAELLGA